MSGRDSRGRFAPPQSAATAAVSSTFDLAPGIKQLPEPEHRIVGSTPGEVVRGSADTTMGTVPLSSKYDLSRLPLPAAEITRKPEYDRLRRAHRPQNITVSKEDIGW